MGDKPPINDTAADAPAESAALRLYEDSYSDDPTVRAEERDPVVRLEKQSPEKEQHQRAWLDSSKQLVELHQMMQSYGKMIDFLMKADVVLASNGLTKLPEGWHLRKNSLSGVLIAIEPDQPLVSDSVEVNNDKIEKLQKWLDSNVPDVDRSLKEYAKGSNTFLKYGDEITNGSVVLAPAPEPNAEPGSTTVACVRDKDGWVVAALDRNNQIVYSNAENQLTDNQERPLLVKGGRLTDEEGNIYERTMAGRFRDGNNREFNASGKSLNIVPFDLITHRYDAETLGDGEIRVTIDREYQQRTPLSYNNWWTNSVGTTQEIRTYNGSDLVPILSHSGEVNLVAAADLPGRLHATINHLGHDGIKFATLAADLGMCFVPMARAAKAVKDGQKLYATGQFMLSALGWSAPLVPAMEQGYFGETGKEIPKLRSQAIMLDIALNTLVPKAITTAATGRLFGMGEEAVKTIEKAANLTNAGKTGHAAFKAALPPFALEIGSNIYDKVERLMRGSSVDNLLNETACEQRITMAENDELPPDSLSDLMRNGITSPTAELILAAALSAQEREDCLKTISESDRDQEILLALARLLYGSKLPEGALPDVLATRTYTNYNRTAIVTPDLHGYNPGPISVPIRSPDGKAVPDYGAMHFKPKPVRVNLPPETITQQVTNENALDKLAEITLTGDTELARIGAINLLYRFKNSNQSHIYLCQKVLADPGSTDRLRQITLAQLEKLLFAR